MYQLINLVFLIFLFFLLKKKKNFWNNVCLFCIVSNLSDYNYFIFVFIRGRTHKLFLLFVLSICDVSSVWRNVNFLVFIISSTFAYRKEIYLWFSFKLNWYHVIFSVYNTFFVVIRRVILELLILRIKSSAYKKYVCMFVFLINFV